MVSEELLTMLRCPNCIRDAFKPGILKHRGDWLICTCCDRKYPISHGIPVMLISEGDRFRDVPSEQLPEVLPSGEYGSLPKSL
jgi:uncharacterized protein YbaR (Trm112 family)